MPWPSELRDNPEFHRLPLDERRKRLAERDPEFRAFSPDRQASILSEAAIRSTVSRAGHEVPAAPSGGLLEDVKLGFRSGVADLARSAASAAGAIPWRPAKDVAQWAEGEAREIAPKPEEMRGREGIGHQVLQTVGSLPPALVKYLPAAVAGKYAPLVGGAIGAASHASEGLKPALEAGAKDTAAFYLLGKTAQIPKAMPRIAASAAVSGGLSAVESGGDPRSTAVGAVMGGVLGAAGAPKVPRTPAAAHGGGINALRDAEDSLRKVLAPQTRSFSAAVGTRTLRATAGLVRRDYDVAQHAVAESRKAISSLDPQDAIQWAIDIEKRRPQQNLGKLSAADLQGAADTVKRIFDNELKVVERDSGRKIMRYQAGKVATDTFVMDYLPHMYKDPVTARARIAEFYSQRRKLSGTQKGLKARKREDYTLEDGLKDGMEPVTNNPVDWFMLRLKEMERFRMAHLVRKELGQDRLIRWVKDGQRGPSGWRELKGDSVWKVDKVGKRSGTKVTGHMWAPDTLADVIDNYLSPGLRGNAAYRGLQVANNTLLNFQLGWSAFHLGFTSVDAITSQVALAMERGVEGVRKGSVKTMGKAVVDLAKAPTAFISNAKTGRRLMQEWNKPGSTGDPMLARVVELGKEAGGSAQLDPFYKTAFRERTRELWKAGRYFAAGLRVPFAMTEKAASLLMDHVVPWQKLGVFYEMARFELDRMPTGATRDQVREVMQKAWDSVDNRMGMLVYDNLMWNRMVKDLLMASVRSVGWNLGTWRELGGGVMDVGRAARAATTGRNVEFTHRMAYIPAMFLTAGTLGGITNYLFTGERPKDYRDLFFPRTGRKDEYGNDNRISIPSYVKDVFHYGTNFWGTIWGKVHPSLGLASDLMRNRDFFNTEISSPDDPWTRRALDSAVYAITQATPISVQQIAKEHKMEYPWYEQALAFVGGVAAPGDVKKSAAEKLAAEFMQRKRLQAPRTRENSERYEHIRELERKLRTHSPDAVQVGRSLLASGDLTQADIDTAYRRAKQAPLEREFKQLSLEEAEKVYRAANEGEKARLRPLLQHKLENGEQALLRLPMKRRKELMHRVMESLREGRRPAPPAARGQ